MHLIKLMKERINQKADCFRNDMCECHCWRVLFLSRFVSSHFGVKMKRRSQLVLWE